MNSEKITYTKEELENYLDGIELSLQIFRKLLKNKTMKIYLSNGETIEIGEQKDQIAHVLGINYIKLKEKIGMKEIKNSEQLLEQLIKNKDGIIKKVKNKELTVTQEIFSGHGFKKIKSFVLLQSKTLQDIKFIIKYNDARSEDYQNPFGHRFDYMIGINNENDTITLLGIAKREDGKYDIITNQLINKSEEETIRKKINHQEILIPHKAEVYSENSENPLNTICLNTLEKIERIKLYDRLAQKYTCTLNLSEMCINLLKIIEKKNSLKQELTATREILKEYNDRETNKYYYLTQLKHNMISFGVSTIIEDYLLEKSIRELTEFDRNLLSDYYSWIPYQRLTIDEIIDKYDFKNPQALTDYMTKIYKKIQENIDRNNVVYQIKKSN